MILILKFVEICFIQKKKILKLLNNNNNKKDSFIDLYI